MPTSRNRKHNGSKRKFDDRTIFAGKSIEKKRFSTLTIFEFFLVIILAIALIMKVVVEVKQLDVFTDKLKNQDENRHGHTKKQHEYKK